MTMWIVVGICASFAAYAAWLRHELRNAPTDKELWEEETD